VAIVNEKEDSVSLFGDAFNRVNLFYGADRRCPVISTEFKDVISCFNAIEFDPAVFCCLMISGYPPAKHSPYSGLKRLAIGERLLLKDNGIHLIKAEAKPVLSAKMGPPDLERYNDALINAILSRSSQHQNWVAISGGWDSTIILGVLREYFDAANVQTVVAEVKLSDGRIFNPYEVDKAKKIAQHYGVPLNIARLDLNDIGLTKIWPDFVGGQHSSFVYEYPFLFQAIAGLIKAKSEPDAAVFFGSFADSLHNFGFSQYVSLPYLNYDFRHYGDKLKSYLYSPSFFQKVLDNTFEDDFAFKLFRWHASTVEFTDTSSMPKDKKIFQYLLSFMLSKSRLPFASIAPESIFSSSVRVRFEEWLYENYFKDAVEQIDCENMYFWLTRIYQQFYLQGIEKGLADASFYGFEKRLRQPFYDLRLVRFLQTMPEDWGRGLEWRSTKYPLHNYGLKKLRVPVEIIESIPHSYISETDEGRSIDLRSQIISNSVFTSTVWESVKSSSSPERLFDKEWFKIDELNNILKTSDSGLDSITALRQLMLLSSFQES